MTDTLYRVTGPAFSAGLVVNLNGRVVRAAPILHKLVGAHIKDVLAWAKAQRRPYAVTLVGPDPYQTLTPGQAVFPAGRRGRGRPSVRPR